VRPVYLVSVLLLWAGSSAAQSPSTPGDTTPVSREFQHAPPHPAPPPPGKPAQTPKIIKPVQPGPTPTAAAPPVFKIVDQPRLLESWARPYLQASLGYAHGGNWNDAALGAYAGINFVASGNALLGFRVGVENFRTGPVVAPADFWQASVVARVGFVAGDRLLPYIVLGPAVATSATKSLVGTTVGMGAEYRINQNWSATLELDYSRFGSGMNSFAWSPQELSHGEIRGGLLYHFPISPPQK
jgi:opacity protein-like surface antigen